MTRSAEKLPLMSGWGVLVLVAVVAVGIRAWWTATVDTQPVTDFAWYYDRAVGLAHGQGYHVDGVTTAYWPVGYPAFLGLFFAVFGPSLALAKGLNLALTVLGIGLSWLVARRLFPSPWVAHLTAALLAIHPAWVAYSSILASEPLYVALTLGGTVALLSFSPGRWWVAASGGLLFGAAALVRPQAVVIPLVLVACLAFWDGKESYKGQVWRALGCVYACVALALLPWTVRNYLQFGQFVFVSTNGGDNLLIGHHPSSTGLYQQPTLLAPEIGTLSETERDRLSRRLAIEAIKSDPARSFSLVWPKLKATFLTGTDAPYWAFQTEKGRLIAPGMDNLRPLYLNFSQFSKVAPSVVLGIFAIGLTLGLLRKARPVVATPLAMIVVTAGLVCVFFGNPRFGYPVVPFMLMVGSHPWTMLFGRVTAESRSS